MSSIRGLSSSKSGFVGPSIFEPLEGRQLFAVARPDHVVIVIEQDRASDAIGNPIWAYLNQIASTGLVYSNSQRKKKQRSEPPPSLGWTLIVTWPVRHVSSHSQIPRVAHLAVACRRAVSASTPGHLRVHRLRLQS